VGQYKNSQRQTIGAHSQHGIGIRREGNRIFAQITGKRSWPKHVLLPPVTDELMPESETVVFERLSGVSITFSRDTRGSVTGLTGHYHGKAFSYEKISDEPPAPEPLKPCVAIKLDTKLIDACVGHYEFAPNAAFPTGMKLTISRQINQLTGQASGENFIKGIFDIYPESENNFFIKLNGAQLTFIKNDDGNVTAVTYHFYASKFPDCEGKKLKD
jgi:hypothetical protein